MNWAQPYGPLVETTLTLLTWNVWGDYGPHTERSEQIERVVRDLDPDVITLQEWAGQAGDLGYVQAASSGGPLPCVVLSRWPVVRKEERTLEGGRMPGTALFCEL